MTVEGLEICIDASASSATRIRGLVRGRVVRECRCDTLTLALVQRGSYVRGFPAIRNERARQQLGGATTWPAGHALHVPFDLAAPGFPPSYEGTLQSLSWELELALQLAGDTALACTQPLPVAVDHDAGIAVIAPPPDRALVAQVSKRPVLIASAVIALATGLAAVGHATGSWIVWPGVGVAAVAVLALLGLLVQWHNESRMGNVQLGFESEAGGALHVVLWTRPDAPGAKVRVELLAEEVVYSDFRSKGDRTKTCEVVFRHVLELVADGAGAYRAPVPSLVERGAPFTMQNGLGSGVTWRAVAVVTAERGIRIERTRPFELRPARGPGSTERGPQG